VRKSPVFNFQKQGFFSGLVMTGVRKHLRFFNCKSRGY